jgi:hypothetical protein
MMKIQHIFHEFSSFLIFAFEIPTKSALRGQLEGFMASHFALRWNLDLSSREQHFGLFHALTIGHKANEKRFDTLVYSRNDDKCMNGAQQQNDYDKKLL